MKITGYFQMAVLLIIVLCSGCTSSNGRVSNSPSSMASPAISELLRQSEPEAREVALAIELFTNGSLNTFAKETNVNIDNRFIVYDIRDLGKQLKTV
jgi:hypothetical protein